ncbi:hypothetical protein ACFWY5_52715 [Nonomuraea sp. NPDC059007]|uniref:hypothetical protein n=1 Tax=Nonomuraea sp. NPDC059007 TaxID=3346692 RepID=UPI0036CD3A21
MTEIPARVDRLCVVLGENGAYLRDIAESAGVGRTLARIEAAVCRDDQRADDEQLERDLDALDDAMARSGHGYLTHPVRIYRKLPGKQQTSAIDAWVCPAFKACARLLRVREVEGAVCAITGQRLKKLQFRS